MTKNNDDDIARAVNRMLSADSGKRTIRSWAWMNTPEKAQEYYEQNYAGNIREEVMLVDLGFCLQVGINGWNENVFPQLPWSEYDIEKAKAYRVVNHRSSSRLQVRKKDPSFYTFCEKKGWLDEIIPNKKD